jgi:hypothetical protein
VDILEWQSVRTINEWLEKQRFKFKINPKHLAPLKNTCLHYNGQEYTAYLGRSLERQAAADFFRA